MESISNNEDKEKILLEFLEICKVPCVGISQLSGLQIPRETLLSETAYKDAKHFIPKFKKIFSSSYLTSLQSGAEKNQRWPLLNLLRQILKSYKYNLTPKRLANGYSKTGKKLYRRIFLVSKMNSVSQGNNDKDNDKEENTN